MDLMLSRKSVETLVITLLVAGVSGLTLIAYRYPSAYRVMLVPIGAVWLFAFAGPLLYKLGAIAMQIQLLDERLQGDPTKPLKSVEYLISDLRRDSRFISRTAVVSVLVAAYLAFLFAFPILGIKP